MKVRKYFDTVWCQCLEAGLEHGLFFHSLEGVPVSEAMVVTKVLRQPQSSGGTHPVEIETTFVLL